MKTINRLSTAGAVAMALLLGTSAAQALEVIFSENTATAILDLNVNGTFYNVAFLRTTGNDLYGNPPSNFDFDTVAEAEDANTAVVAALNTEPAVTSVGPASMQVYGIGYAWENELVIVAEGGYVIEDWITQGTKLIFDENLWTYASFTKVSTTPDPSIAVGLGGPEGEGYLEMMAGQSPHDNEAWVQVDFPAYNAAVGSTQPIFCNVDNDNRDELVIGLGSYPENGG